MHANNFAEEPWPKIPPVGYHGGYRSVEKLEEDLHLLYRVQFDQAYTPYELGKGLTAGASRNVAFTNTIDSRTTGVPTISEKPSVEEIDDYMYGKKTGSRLIWTTMSMLAAFFWADLLTSSEGGTGIRIIIIDAKKVPSPKYTATEIFDENMRRDGRNPNIAFTLQVVFIVGEIPAEAILSDKNWESVEKELPYWFQEEPIRPLPSWSQQQEPDSNRKFIQAHKDSKVRTLLLRTRQNYKRYGKGAHVEREQLWALDFAQFLLRQEGDVEDERMGTLLCELAWYILTVPLATFPGDVVWPGHTAPSRDWQERYKALVEREVGVDKIRALTELNMRLEEL